MAATLSQAGEKALQILGDGRWHDVRKVLIEVGTAYPPGVATRRVEADRRSGADAPARRARPRSTEDIVADGQRRLARQLLTAWRKQGRIEFSQEHQVWSAPGVKVRGTQALLSLREKGEPRDHGAGKSDD